MIAGLVLFKRWPRLHWQTRTDEQIIPLAMQATYPALAEEFAVLERELMPHFRQLDDAALRAQNQFRREQVILIFGSALAAALGATQAALGRASWVGGIEVVLAAGLAIVALRARAGVTERLLHQPAQGRDAT